MESPNRSIQISKSSWPCLKELYLPIKEIISQEDIIDNTKKYNADENKINNEGQQQYIHDNKYFCVTCGCNQCVNYLSVILNLVSEMQLSKDVCDATKEHLKLYYKPFYEKAMPYFENTLKKFSDNSMWIVNGTVNATRMHHFAMASNLPFSNNTLFALLTTILMTEDNHRIFEFFCYQIECFVKAYAEGIKYKLSLKLEGKSHAQEILLDVVSGYENLCAAAENLSNFLFAFQSNHLRKFSLNWLLLNKRMYQIWVYEVFLHNKILPKCLMQAKLEVNEETFETLLFRYNSFDNEMKKVRYEWTNVWNLLNKHHMTKNEQFRRIRIKHIHNLLENMSKLNIAKVDKVLSLPELKQCSNKEIMLENLIFYIKNKFSPLSKERISATVSEEKCIKCNSCLDIHKFDCKCVTCLIAGANYNVFNLEDVCSKCIQKFKDQEFENYVKAHENEGIEDPMCHISPILEIDKINEYHISWAVFKHLHENQSYPHKIISEEFICKNCKKKACVLAKKLLNKKIERALSKSLIAYFQPLNIEREELAQITTDVVLYAKLHNFSLIEKNSSVDSVIKTLWTFLISSFAYDICRTDTSDSINFNNLKLENKDLVLSDEFKEYIFSAGDILELCKRHKSNKNVPKKVNNNQSTDSPLISNNKSSTLPTEKMTKSNEANLCSEHKTTVKSLHASNSGLHNGFEKKKTKLCKGNIPPELEKELGSNKFCFHAKDCSHVRVNETRNRLRKKLNRSTNEKKKVTNKTVKKPTLKLYNESEENMVNANASDNILEGKPVNQIIIKSDEPKLNDSPKIQINSESETGNILSSEVEQGPLNKLNKNVDIWIKNTLSFIEGSDNGKKLKPTIANDKKAAKKAKQKQKKGESKRIEELEKLRDQFHDIYFKEFSSKHELKKQKLLKKKDKKRITDLELNIKKLNKAKAKIESSVLELIGSVKASNSEFKFTYLPTKEQQIEFLNNTKYKPKTFQNSNITDKNLLSGPETVPIPQAAPNIENKTENSQKQMVTIRRVIVPNLPEPQVTVTAKGSSPDKDKLLYTFINGLLVPAAALDSEILQILNPDMFSDLDQVDLFYKADSKPTEQLKKCLTFKIENNNHKTKKQLKKERQRLNKNLLTNKLENCSESIKSNHKNLSKHDKGIVEKLNRQEKTVPKNFLANGKNSSQLICEQNEKKTTNRRLTATNNSKTSNVETKASISNNKKSKTKNDNDLETVKKTRELTKSEKMPKPKRNIINDSKTPIIKTQARVPNHAKLLDILPDNTKISQTDNFEEKLNAVASNDQKQRKKRCNQQNKDKKISLAKDRTNIDKTVLNAENVVKSLNYSMQKLHINPDTTIEIAKKSSDTPTSNTGLNVSIMEQLNRGVLVENLALPPGITLTKVDPEKAEVLRAKRESIGKLSQPIENQSPRNIVTPAAFLPNFARHTNDQSGGVIMIDAMKPPTVVSNIEQTKDKKNKKKNKKKIDNNETKKSHMPKMVTLRNPMFHNSSSNSSIPAKSKINALPIATDQPAAIIKNENGMFTIRNPALHQSIIDNTAGNHYQIKPTNNLLGHCNIGKNFNQCCENELNPRLYNSAKQLSAIGSEIKSAQLQKKSESPWQYSPLKYSSLSDGSYDNTRLNSFTTMSSKNDNYDSRNYFNPISPSLSCSYQNKEHRCDDSPPSSFSFGNQFNHYYDANNYGNEPYLQNLFPGQKLNNEVTIHNINESKFNQNILNQKKEIFDKTKQYNEEKLSRKTSSSVLNSFNYQGNIFEYNGFINPGKSQSSIEEPDISYKPFNYGFSVTENNGNIATNATNVLANQNIINKKSSSPQNGSLDEFVKTMNSLKLANENNKAKTENGNVNVPLKWWVN